MKKNKYRYEYEYTSPFGENWRVDKLHLGIIWLPHSRPYHIGVYDYNGIDNYIKELEEDSIKKIRFKKLKNLNK